jgi:hypothetical protein
MFLRKLFLGLVTLAVVAAFSLATMQRLAYAQSAQGEGDCASVDYSSIQQTLMQSQAAADADDPITALQLQAQARADLRKIINDCSLKPLLEAEGLDAATIQAVSEMPFCQYRFEATVRSGADAGMNLQGTLGLMQNTPTSAVGFVYPLDSAAQPVPVMATLGEDRAITLSFTLGADKTIVGTGYVDASIKGCTGGIEGIFKGPGADDTGDWIGLGCTLNPSSMSCTPSVSLDPNQLPILQPSTSFHPEKPSGQEGAPPVCVPMRDAACVAACNGNATCAFACPTVGTTCH